MNYIWQFYDRYCSVYNNNNNNGHSVFISDDRTRVKLSYTDDEVGSDYINANYIHVSLLLLNFNFDE